MRKHWMKIAVVLLLFVGVASAVDPPMQPFTSTDGRFSILFPGIPKQDSQTVQLKGGGSTTLYQFWVELDNNNVSYMFMYNDYSSDYANDAPQTVLASVRDGSVNGKTLTSDVAIDLNGVPGRAFTATDSNYNYAVHDFLAGKRLYQLIVVSSKDHPATLTDQFMNSFRIL
ncbi:MAG: hypothetical protein WCA89_01655 [Terracidiphilus sp.]|jgi:hypothetical protein